MHQQTLAREQMMEQRAEASRSRERAALAEVISSAEAVLMAARHSPAAVNESVAMVQSAMARWRIEVGRAPMQFELMKWSALLISAANDCVLNLHVNDGVSEQAFNKLFDVVTELTAAALVWPDADKNERAKLLAKLTGRRAELAGPFADRTSTTS